MADTNNVGEAKSINGRIVVINPNSTAAVTEGIDHALDPYRFADGPIFECITIENGPPGIATQQHVDEAAVNVCDVVKRQGNSADAFIIACFSDPGVLVAKEITNTPVFGIGASSYAQAMLLGERFGIIAILPESTIRQKRAVRVMGVESRYAGSVPIGLGAEELQGDHVRDRMIKAGSFLIEEHGADVLIMGCAGMADFRAAIEAALDVPVIDPSQAAAIQAIAAVRRKA